MNNKKLLNIINNNGKFSVICLIVIIVVFLEFFLFNFRFFQGLGYEPVVLERAGVDSSVSTLGNSVFKFNSNDGKLEFSDIDTEVKNIYIDVEGTKSLPSNMDAMSVKERYDRIIEEKADKLFKIKIKINDYSNVEGIEMPERSIVSNVERTKYIPLSLKGKSDKLVLEFKNAEGREVKIKNIILNKGVPFHFSIIRVIVILILIGLIYVIRPGSQFYKYRLNLKKSWQRWTVGAIAVLQIILMVSGCFINPKYVYNTISHQDQYNELADAILDRHFYLNEIPDSKLAEMENPYDYEARNRNGVYARWDHAYYEGKYYVYFGIVPALLFNVPAMKLFNIRLIPFTCILILMPIFILMSYLLIYALARRFLDENKEGVPLLLYFMMTTLFVNGIGTAFMMVWPDMYTLPIFTGLTFAVSGLYFWLTALREKDGETKLSSVRLFAGSLCTALIAGCRPQMLVVIFIAIPLFWGMVFKERALFSKKSVKETICFVLPIAVFAVFMFFYNYSRFGSIFDFGANYNLTTNDMTSRGIKLSRIPQGIFSYLLQPLSVEGTFPYITTTSFSTKYMGITIKEGMYGGLLFLQPVLWILLILPKVRKEIKEKGLYAVTVLLLIFTVVIVSADAIMAGILPRYFMDFGWCAMIAACIVVFSAWSKYKDREYWKIFNYCMPVCFAGSIILVFLTVMGVRYFSPAEVNPEMFWKIACGIQFWM